MDGILIYVGTLRVSTGAGDSGQAIVFSNNPEIVEKFRKEVYYCGDQEQEVSLIDEMKAVSNRFMEGKDRGHRTAVKIDGRQRPATSSVRRV